MNAEHNQAKAIFLEALEKHDDQWPAFLDQACAGQPALRRRVGVLLEAHREAGTAPALASAEGPAPLAGSGIGPYKLLRQIGEGGMGTVFLAEQTQPVHRQVALKVIKAGMDSRQVLARFEAERQALALMDHPNIARVLDAGTTDSGLPYFVMELVQGVPVTRFCDEQHLTPRERLELFIPVCQAVQHAHQKGIIHRDLKPSNVLVCLYDGKPVPKVIDFGVAKATGPRLTEKTLFTEVGSVVGTLEYMSPEQAELNQLDVDTRSDIYSLGVLLYELLTGTTPLERKRCQEVAFLEVLRLIREEESPRPSTRLSTTEGLPAIAANRGLEPKKLSGLVRGELDWVVMKALEKDRNRRYEAANALAEDIRRYLRDEPVQACPPSAWYSFRKFARRHTVGLATTALLAAVLAGSAAGLVWSWRQTLDALRRVELARDGEREERRKAEVALAGKTVALAHQAWLTDDLAAARRLLDECPPAYRDRGWHYVHRRCHGCLAVLGENKGSVARLAWSSDGRFLAAGGTRGPGGGHVVTVYDTAGRGGPVTLSGHSCAVADVVFTPDGLGCVSLAQLSSRPAPRLADRPSWPVLIGYIEAKMWDLATGKERHNLPRTPVANWAALSPDGRYVAFPRPPGIVVLEIATRKELPAYSIPPVYSKLPAFDRAGRLLAVLVNEGKGNWPAIHFVDVGTGKQAHAPMPCTGRSPDQLALSPDGRRIAVASFQPGGKPPVVTVREVGTGREVVSLQGHSQAITCLTFSPDGSRLAAGTTDRLVMLWDLATGKELLTFRGHKAQVNSVAFGPDGLRLASGGGDGTVRVWDTRLLDGL